MLGRSGFLYHDFVSEWVGVGFYNIIMGRNGFLFYHNGLELGGAGFYKIQWVEVGRSGFL